MKFNDAYIEREKITLRNPEGKYLQTWQYSQGIFDYETTDDPGQACDLHGLTPWLGEFKSWTYVRVVIKVSYGEKVT